MGKAWAHGTISIFLFCGRVLASDEAILPNTWTPDLSLVAKHLQIELSETSAQQSINALSGRLAEVRNAQLALLYVELWQKLVSPARTALADEQANWIKKRAQKTSESLESNNGGSAGPAEANCEFTKITESRIRELSERLQNLPKNTTK